MITSIEDAGAEHGIQFFVVERSAALESAGAASHSAASSGRSAKVGPRIHKHAALPNSVIVSASVDTSVHVSTHQCKG